MSPATQGQMSAPKKAAVLLALLGDEASTEICRHLGKDELRLLAQEITDLDEISVEMATQVLQEYQGMTTPGTAAVAQGGPAYATRLVTQTLGDEASRPLVEKVIRAKEAVVQNLEALDRAEPKQLAKILQEEHPQTVALVLSQLHGRMTKAVLLLLPEDLRASAMKRLAQMQNFSPDILNRVAERLRGKLKSGTESDRRAFAGIKAVADLLNRLDDKLATGILETIEQENEGLAASIREQMFTFEDFGKVPDAGLRELLSQIDKKSLATALKGANETIQNRFYGCMSSRAVEMLKEDSEAMGPAKAKDIALAQTEIIAVARKLESEGKISLKNNEEEEVSAG